MDPHTQPPETQHCLCIFEKSEDASSLPFRGKDPEVTRNMSTDAPHRELCLARRARVWLPLCPLLSSAATFDVHSGAAPPPTALLCKVGDPAQEIRAPLPKSSPTAGTAGRSLHTSCLPANRNAEDRLQRREPPTARRGTRADHPQEPGTHACEGSPETQAGAATANREFGERAQDT